MMQKYQTFRLNILLFNYNKITGEVIDTKVREKRIVYKSNTFGFVHNSHLDRKVATLGAKSKLKAEQDKNMKL